MRAPPKKRLMASAPANGTMDLSRQISLVGGPNNAPIVSKRLRTLEALVNSASLVLQRFFKKSLQDTAACGLVLSANTPISNHPRCHCEAILLISI